VSDAAFDTILQLTARVSALFFLGAFSAEALRVLWPGAATRFLGERRALLTLAFFLAFTAHFLVLGALAHARGGERFLEEKGVPVLVLGAAIYALMAGLALSALARGPASPARLRFESVAFWIVGATLARPFIMKAIAWRHPLYVPASLVFLAAFAVRIAASRARWREPARAPAVLVLLLGMIAGATGCARSGGSSGTAAPAIALPPSVVPATVSATPTPVAVSIQPRTKTATVVARSGEGFLEDQGGCRLLHLKGTPRERGIQYGELLGDEVAANRQVLFDYAKTAQNAIPAVLVPVLQPLVTAIDAMVYQPYFPADVADMMQGVIEGAARRSPPVAIATDDLVFMNSIIDLAATVQMPIAVAPLFKCSGTAVLPPLTANGKVFQERNVDLFTGTGLESHAVVVVEKPATGFTWANAGWAGMLGSASGMNEHGVGVSQVWAFSVDVNVGQPWPLMTRRILEECQNVDGIEAIFQLTPRTYGSNFVFADRGDGRGAPRAIAVESTARQLAQFGDADLTENASWNGIPLSIRVPHAVFRGDTAMDESIFKLQYQIPPGRDPRTLGGYCDRYAQQASMIQAYAAKGTPIGLAEMETISRTIAEPSGSLQCVVYESSDLVMHVANSRIVPGGPTAMARDEPFHDYDLDYYLPTVAVTPDKASYSLGDTLALTIDVANHGRPRRLDVQVSVVAAGQTYTLGSLTLVASSASPAHVVAPFVFPAVPAGAAAISLELDESGTRDVVDYAAAAVTAR
jgi:hypothetical protein